MFMNMKSFAPRHKFGNNSAKAVELFVCAMTKIAPVKVILKIIILKRITMIIKIKMIMYLQ